MTSRRRTKPATIKGADLPAQLHQTRANSLPVELDERPRRSIHRFFCCFAPMLVRDLAINPLELQRAALERLQEQWVELAGGGFGDDLHGVAVSERWAADAART